MLSGVGSFVLKMDFDVSALKNKTNDFERGDETKGKLLPDVDMLQ